MNKDIGPRHVLLMWNLLFTGTEPKLSETRPNFTKKQLAPLIDDGLIVLEKRGRANHLVLTDRAWRWSEEHLDAPFSHSLNAAPPLKALLPKLKAYLAQTGTPLAELLTAVPPASAEPPREHIDAAIRSAYLELSGGRWETRLRLAQLRARLAGYARAAQDEALLRMQREGRLVLYPLDDPQDTSAADREAALFLGGAPRHLVYMKR